MINKPVLTKLSPLTMELINYYDSYLPNAFDESLTILQKMNKVMEYLHQIGVATNHMIDEWNKVYDWVLNDGLYDELERLLNDWFKKGKFQDILNHIIGLQINYDLSYTVGQKGDFQTLNDALTELSKRTYTHREHNIKVEVKLLSDYIMREQVHVRGMNLGFIDITSELPEVIVDRQTITRVDSDGGYVSKSLFLGYQGATLPNIKTIFNYNTTGSENDIRTFSLRGSSKLYIHPQCGVKGKATRHIVVSQGGSVSARFAVIRDARDVNVRVSGGGLFSGEYAEITHAEIVNVAVDSSTCNIAFAKCTDAGYDGIRITSGFGTIQATGVDVSRCNRYGVQILYGGTINFFQGIANNIGENAIIIQGGGHISANEATLNDCLGDAVLIEGTGLLDFFKGKALNAGKSALYVRQGGNINAQNALLTNAGGSAVIVTNNATANLQGSDMTGYKGTIGLYCDSGARVNCEGAKIQKVVGQNNSSDIQVRGGSYITMRGATGGTNGNKNVLTYHGVYLDSTATV